MPAGFYLLCTKLAAYLPAKGLPSLSSSEERERQQRLGIEPEYGLCKVYAAAWLLNPSRTTFTDDDIAKAYRELKSGHSHDFISMMEFIKNNGWHTCPLPGHFLLKLSQIKSGVPLGNIEDRDVHYVNCARQHSREESVQKLPLDALDVGDVLLCSQRPIEGGLGEAHFVTIERVSERMYNYYDSAVGQYHLSRDTCKTVMLAILEMTEKRLLMVQRLKKTAPVSPGS